VENDLRVIRKFLYRIKIKDDNSGFDFTGVYSETIDNQLIANMLTAEEK